MSGPSDKAVDAACGPFDAPATRDRIRLELAAAHNPALGLDRSVCLRDMVEPLARLLYERDGEVFVHVEWGQENEPTQNRYRDDALAALREFSSVREQS